MFPSRSRNLVFVALCFCACCSASIGCSGGKDEPAKTEFSEKDKEQAAEYRKQATDEWGRKIK